MREKDESGVSKAVSMKIKPGLSSLKNNPARASDYMKPIIDFISDKIPKKSHKSTSIYMMATAGMRLLNEQTKRNILDDIAKDLRYNHEFAKVRIAIIPGSAEGMYQWITVNSKMRRFAQLGTNTVGVIEMGGASIQVTYQLRSETFRFVMNNLRYSEEAKLAFSDQIVEPELSREAIGYPYKLFSVTFLGLGSNSARDSYIDLLIHHKLNRYKLFNIKFPFFKQPSLDPEKPIVLTDPCLPKGATETVERPTKMLDPAHNRHKSIGFSIEANDKTFKATVIGKSNYLECRWKLNDLLSRAKKEKLNCKQGETCPMSLLENEFIPYEHENFVGLSEFFYTSDEMLNSAGMYNRWKMMIKSYHLCSETYQELVSKFSDLNKSDPDRVRNECFKAVWIETFLSDGLKLPMDYDKLITIGKINSDEIDWTLGAVLDKSLAIERAAEAN